METNEELEAQRKAAKWGAEAAAAQPAPAAPPVPGSNEATEAQRKAMKYGTAPPADPPADPGPDL